MSKTVDFIFDFASPNGYFCHKVIPDIEARTGAKFVYKPCLLGGIHKLSNNQAPMVAFADIPLKMAYDSIEIDRFIKKHAIDEFKMNPNFPIITLQLMRAAVAADMDGYLMEFIEAMMAEVPAHSAPVDCRPLLAGKFIWIYTNAARALFTPALVKPIRPAGRPLGFVSRKTTDKPGP